jgi:hypothetical protein
MLEGFVYKLLDKVESTCKRVREHLINKSLPNPCKSAKEWRNDYEKWKKSRINNNDTD